ncbi:MAG: HD domain-containing protein [Lachnospiraceae bacterium]|nr:HD domain-containing protein [Ruminococcus sp.]MCM1275618.1 HD domain-containing protein [Lachnospiraceae bacterium]
MPRKYNALKLKNQLCFPLYACAKEVVGAYKPYLDELNLTYTQYITMMVMWEDKELRVKELGGRLFLDSGTLTPLLKRLEEKGFVTRRRSEKDERDMLYALSTAIDSIEIELLGLETGHGRRVAALALLMGCGAGYSDEQLRDFVGCCILHDNALTEFIHEELQKSDSFSEADLKAVKDLNGSDGITSRHSVIGERNIGLIPFRTDVSGVILYHHENADGSGDMGKTAAETPLKSQILRLADSVDMSTRFSEITENSFAELRGHVKSHVGTLYSKEAAELFFDHVDYSDIREIREKTARGFLREKLPSEIREYSDTEIHNIAEFFAQIVDCKSEFTERHSMGVARTALRMAEHFGFDPEKKIRFCFAGAFHDIGKLMVSNNILEKPDRLTSDEFSNMKDHAAHTRAILSEIKGIPDIIEWAANHHEKLNGTGYPRGLTAEQLGLEERLMTCADIYQALTEPRPYKSGMPHEKAIAIMKDMVRNGEIDAEIVEEFDCEFKERRR